MKQQIGQIFRRYGKRMAAILGLVLTVFAVAAVYYDDCVTVRSADIHRTGEPEALSSGQKLSQEIVCDRDGLKEIRLLVCTFGRMNRGTLTAVLSDDAAGTTLETWQLDESLLRDGKYTTLMLGKAVRDSKDRTFRLTLTSDAAEGEGASVYRNTSGTYGGLFLDGEQVPGESLCYVTGYRHMTGGRRYLLRFAAVALLTVGVWTLLQFTKQHLVRTFLVLWISLSALFAVSNPLMNTPDEPGHFCRAFEVSLGYPVSEYDAETRTVGRELPLDVDLYSLGTGSIGWHMAEENAAAMTLTQNLVRKDFWNQAVFHPVAYLPQAAGVFAARHLTDNVAAIAYAGRAVNWLCATILICVALVLLPRGKEFAALVCLMPLTLQEAFSLSPDAVMMAMSLLIVSYAMHLREIRQEPMTRRQLVILYLLAWTVTAYKMIYGVLVLFYTQIPAERFRRGAREKWTHAAVIASGMAVITVSWLRISGRFLIRAGTDGGLQSAFVTHHPLQYGIVLLRSVMETGIEMLFGMVGALLAWLNVFTPAVVILAYMLVMANKAHPGIAKRNPADKWLRVVAAFCVIVIVTLSNTALYIQWTYPYEPLIEGMQGRYFVEALLPAYFWVTTDRTDTVPDPQIGFDSQWIVMLTGLCAGLAYLFAQL